MSSTTLIQHNYYTSTLRNQVTQDYLVAITVLQMLEPHFYSLVNCTWTVETSGRPIHSTPLIEHTL